jgi:hypothetical protein
MSAPMDCCTPLGVPAPSTVLASLEPVAAAFVAALPGGARVAAARPVAEAFSRAGELHPLGLFTLHSVLLI